MHNWTIFAIARRFRSIERFKSYPNFAAAALSVVALFLLGYELYGFSAVHSLFADFHSFWCAGRALVHGADPYRASALALCEHAPAPFGLYAAPSSVVVPAPLPPYALALFVPFSLLGYALSAWVWFAFCVAAVLVSVRLIAGVTGVSRIAAALMLVLPAAVVWLPYGEATPIALLGAAVAAWGLNRERASAVGAGLVMLSIEPHLALGAWLCVLVAVPKARISAAIAGVGLLLVSAIAHPTALPEYLGGVLPLHALAKVPRPTQYSATWLFYAAGAPAATALLAGEISYAVLLVFGVAAGLRLQRASNDAVVVFAPIAAAVIGGTFVHASQIALALPFAATLAMRTSGALRSAATVCCGVLAVPWLQGGQQQTVVILGIAAASAVVLALSADRTLTLRVTAATSVLAVLLLFAHRLPVVLTQAPAFPIAERAGEYASASWGRYIWREQSAVRLADWVGKVPTWFALVLLAGCTAIATGAVRYRNVELRAAADE